MYGITLSVDLLVTHRGKDLNFICSITRNYTWYIFVASLVRQFLRRRSYEDLE